MFSITEKNKLFSEGEKNEESLFSLNHSMHIFLSWLQFLPRNYIVHL